MTDHDTTPGRAADVAAAAAEPAQAIPFDRAPTSGSAPGWYRDPTDYTMRRLWSGEDWAADDQGRPLRRRREPSEPMPRRLLLVLLLGSVLPLVASVVLPVPVMQRLQPSGGVGSLSQWESAVWSGVLTGLALWVIGLVVWRACESGAAEQLSRSYEAAHRWHGACLTLVIVTGVLGALGTAVSVFFLTFTAALSGVGNGL